MERLNLSADEVLTTTRSVRKRLDLTRPVSRELITECIEIALQAPTGSNQQGWLWVVVDDPQVKAGLADIYREHWETYSQIMPSFREGDPRGEQFPRVKDSATYLAEHMHEVPVLVVPLIRHRAELALSGAEQASLWASIFPAVWSFQLAARERGLGTVLTTLHLGGEGEAARLLGVDSSRYRQACLIPTAYTIGTDFRSATRLPAADLIRWNHY